MLRKFPGLVYSYVLFIKYTYKQRDVPWLELANKPNGEVSPTARIKVLQSRLDQKKTTYKTGLTQDPMLFPARLLKWHIFQKLSNRQRIIP